VVFAQFQSRQDKLLCTLRFSHHRDIFCPQRRAVFILLAAQIDDQPLRRGVKDLADKLIGYQLMRSGTSPFCRSRNTPNTASGFCFRNCSL
jgi:hypothetical protein